MATSVLKVPQIPYKSNNVRAMWSLRDQPIKPHIIWMRLRDPEGVEATWSGGT